MYDLHEGDVTAALSLLFMVGGVLLIAVAALIQHYTGRHNPVTLLLDRLWRD